MVRLRNLLLGGALAVAFTGATVAVTTPAQAFVTIQDQCNGYTAGWIYWANEANNELVRSNFEETPYFNYAWGNVNYYSNLLWQYNCP